jgi:hypothetical protein
LLSGKSVGLNTLKPLDICILLGSPPNGAMAESLPQGATLQRDGLLLERLSRSKIGATAQVSKWHITSILGSIGMAAIEG